MKKEKKEGEHVDDSARPLWRCEECGRSFANRNQAHACGRHELDTHFEGRPEARILFDLLLKHVSRCGPVKVLPEKTRIAFQVRMSFMAVTPRKSALAGHFVLARRVEHPRFTRIEEISPRNQVHHFRITTPADLDEQFDRWIEEAYRVGEQRHVRVGSREEG